MSDLNKKAFGGLMYVFITVSALIFLSAWTFYYWQAWTFLIVFMTSLSAIFVYLAKNDPNLLARRVKTTEREKSQKIIRFLVNLTVILTGPYALVRHPMYVGGLVMILGIPLALGSWLGLLMVVLFAPVMTWRILDEEKVLAKNLPGYAEYLDKVKYRLVPFVW